MPPKVRFTKEEVTAAALELTRRRGMEALTARALAAELNSSPKPIFGLFRSMEEVQGTVLREADALYQERIRSAMSAGRYPPYKASGMAYIQFAREERELFKLLFMRDRAGEVIQENREELRPILDVIRRNLNITEDEAYLLHLEMWLYVHGIATMLATNYLEWDEEFIDRALTDAYEGLKSRFTGEV